GQDEGVVDGDIRRTEGRIAQELGTVRDLDAIRVNPLLTTEFDQGRVFRTLLETRMQLHDAHRIGRLPLTAFNSSADRHIYRRRRPPNQAMTAAEERPERGGAVA